MRSAHVELRMQDVLCNAVLLGFLVGEAQIMGALQVSRICNSVVSHRTRHGRVRARSTGAPGRPELSMVA